MVKLIKEKNKIYGISRVVSGFSWEWRSKKLNKLSVDEIKNSGYADMKIKGYEYVWNKYNREYILREDSIDEIGSVHTVQGYDLNYIGVIFGKEIDYDFDKNEIIIYKKEFKDTKVKERTTDDELKKYIINSYQVMLSRGIKGCYVYAYNENLFKYLSKYIKNQI